MKKILLFLFSVILFTACSDTHDDNIAPVVDGLPIARLLESQPETYSQWTELLKYADLYNSMNLNAEYTAFVPNDAAMTAYLSKKGYAAVTAMPAADAKLLIRYHTIAGKAYTQSEFLEGVIPDTTATGDNLSVEFREGGLNAIYINGKARIAQLDTKATNGVVHTLETVLEPLVATVWEEASAGRFSILAEAIRLTGWDGLLDALMAEMNGVPVKIKSTLFAVPDQVYKANSINNVADLAAWLGAGNDYTDAGNALYRYVAYHIIGKQTDYNELSTFPANTTTQNIYTQGEGIVNLSVQGENVYINYNKATKEGISITEANITAKNGILHVIDGLMPVFTPDRVTVRWELTDYAELSSLVTSYRKSVSANTTSWLNDPEKVSCYQWLTVPANSSGSVGYAIFTEKDNASRYDLMNHDGLVVNVGLYGWIEMQTPSIIKGNYIVSIHYHSPNAQTRSGKFKLIFDGAYFGNEITANGANTTTATNPTTNVGGGLNTITFTETKSHTMRIIKTDAASVLLDYIDFRPF